MLIPRHATFRLRASVLILAALAVGCLARADDGASSATTKPATQAAAPSRARVAFCAEPLTLDGRLDEAAWQRAESYPLARLPSRSRRGREAPAAYEAGAVRFVRDDRFLYVAFDFADEDLVQAKDEDYQHHYLSGDVGELFLKPVDAPHYWEFYATPHGRRTVFFFPVRKVMTDLTENYDRTSGLQVAVHLNGSLNDSSDTDHGWTSELAVPLDELAAAGVPLDAGHRWQVLVGRYNYGRRDTPMPELSSFPALSRKNFHAYELWLPLELEPRPEPTTTAPTVDP